MAAEMVAVSANSMAGVFVRRAEFSAARRAARVSAARLADRVSAASDIAGIVLVRGCREKAVRVPSNCISTHTKIRKKQSILSWLACASDEARRPESFSGLGGSLSAVNS